MKFSFDSFMAYESFSYRHNTTHKINKSKWHIHSCIIYSALREAVHDGNIGEVRVGFAKSQRNKSMALMRRL